MKYTFHELVTRHLDAHDDIFTKVAVYPFAIPITSCLLNFTTVTANTVTISGLVLGIAGCLGSIFTQNTWYLLIGFASFYVCDFVDGQIASARGGSQVGAVLDLVTDRTVLFLSVFCLALRHSTANQTYELFLLCCYLCLFAYLDAVFLARYVATRQYATGSDQGWEVHQANRHDSFSVWVLFPTRLSSPLFFVAVLATTKSFVAGYYLAICCVFSEYIVLALKTGLHRCFRLTSP